MTDIYETSPAEARGLWAELDKQRNTIADLRAERDSLERSLGLAAKRELAEAVARDKVAEELLAAWDEVERLRQREQYLQRQADGQMQASASWQREAFRLRDELEKLLNPKDEDCLCVEYEVEDCPIHGIMRLLWEERDKNKLLAAELTQARRLLLDLVSTEPCRLDIHGYCQEHRASLVPGEKCPNQAAADLLMAPNPAGKEA